jgi:hypothetical protein
LLHSAETVWQSTRQRNRPFPGREQRAHRRDWAIEWRTTLAPGLQEQNAKPPAGPQPTAELGRAAQLLTGTGWLPAMLRAA